MLVLSVVGRRLAHEREAQVAFKRQPLGCPLLFDEASERAAYLFALAWNERLQKVAEGAGFRPPEQRIGILMDVDQRAQLAAVIDEAICREERLEFLVRQAEHQVGVLAIVSETSFGDGLAKQQAGLMRPGWILHIQSDAA